MVRFLKQQHPSARLYLLGESMGGAFAMDYMKDSSEVGGLILLAPALNVNSAQVFRLGNLPLLPVFLFARRHPAISLVGKRLDESSRDPQWIRSEEHTSELQSLTNLVCRLLLEKKKKK